MFRVILQLGDRCFLEYIFVVVIDNYKEWIALRRSLRITFDALTIIRQIACQYGINPVPYQRSLSLGKKPLIYTWRPKTSIKIKMTNKLGVRYLLSNTPSSNPTQVFQFSMDPGCKERPRRKALDTEGSLLQTALVPSGRTINTPSNDWG